MGKRVLVTSTDLMMIQFLAPHIQNLAEHGYEMEIACSDVGGRMDEVRDRLRDYTAAIHTVRLVRSPASLTNLKGYRDMKRVIREGDYDVIWTNEPVMGVVTRLAARDARRKGTKVLYMVHGFHFYKGAPLWNWMVYYPVEKLMAGKADMIATVNREDYRRAGKMNVRRTGYIHGIGINTERLTPGESRKDIRKELHLAEDDFIVLSVGELNKNKNQQVIIRAAAMLNDRKVHCILCGRGGRLKQLQDLASKLGVNRNIHFLGYRKDVVDICSRSDVFVMASRREGLPVASLEAMYCGLPLITSGIRGLEDVMEDGESGYMCRPDDAAAFARAIRKIMKHPELKKKMAQRNRRAVIPFCIEHTREEVLDLIDSLSK